MMNYGFSRSISEWLRWIGTNIGLREQENTAQMGEKGRYNKFSSQAQSVLSFAQAEAQRLRHRSIGTEHLLLGLVRQEEGGAARVLSSLGVDLEKARKAVEGRLGHGNRVVIGEIGLTPQAKNAIKRTFDEAQRLNDSSVKTEHLLLGLLDESANEGTGVLEDLGLNLQEVRAKTLQSLYEQRQ